jgi:sugar lactone lactonase YvrE
MNLRLAALTCAVVTLLVAAPSAMAFVDHPSLGEISGPSAGVPFASLHSESVAVNDHNGHVLVADSGSGTVYDYTSPDDTSPAAWTGSVTPSGSFGGGTVAVAVDNATGDVYVADTTNAVIDKLDASGALIATFGTGGHITGPATPAGSFSPATSGALGIAVNQANGNLYVIDAGHQAVDLFSASGAYLSQINDPAAVTAGLYGGGGAYADGIAVSAATGHVFVSDSYPVQIFEFDAAGSYVRTIDGSGSPDGSFGGGYVSVALDDANGYLYAASSAHQVVDQFDLAGTYLSQVIGVPTSGNPGLAVDQASGDIYVSGNADGSVRRFSSEGVVLTDVTTDAATGVAPTAATLNGHLAPDGGFDVSDCHFDYGTDDTYGNTTPCAEGSSFSSPAGVHADLTGLQPNTSYHFRLVVANANGSSSGADEAFTTPGPSTIDSQSAIDVTKTTATLQAQVNPNGLDTTYHFEYGTTAAYGSSIPIPDADLGSDPSDQLASQDLTGLAPGTVYHFRVVATNAQGTTTGGDQTLQTVPAVQIDTVSAAGLTTTAADLEARINPGGLATSYHFEWGTDTSYGTSVPAADASAGAGSSTVLVTQHLTGLTPNTNYHFRLVATNASGTTTSGDHTFIYDTSGQAGLPDNRAYEMVTPVQKSGAKIGETFLAALPDISEDGSRLILTSIQCFAGASSCTAVRQMLGQPYAFDRTSAGWGTTPLTPPATDLGGATSFAVSAEAGTALFRIPSPPSGQDNWIGRRADGTLVDFGPVTQPADGPNDPANSSQGLAMMGTADLSRVIWNANQKGGWPGDPGGGTISYERVGTGSAAPLFTGVTGGAGSTDFVSNCGALVGNGDGGSKPPGTMSADGSTYFFAVGGGPGCVGSGANAGVPVPADTVYARIDAAGPSARTVRLSGRSPATCTTVACLGSRPGDANFEGASADGSKALFTSTQQLTDSASQDPLAQDSSVRHTLCAGTVGAGGCNLYLYDFSRPAGHELLDVSAGDTSGGGPRVRGLVAISDDGSHIYFVAKGVLDTAPNARGERAAANASNLYVFEDDAAHPDGRTRFIATLPDSDDDNASSPGISLWRSGAVAANVTPDGRFLVFPSGGGLTADHPEATAAAQLYRYDAQSDQLVRISVGEHGFNDNGNAATANATIVTAQSFAYRLGPGRSDPTMSHDGSYIFFQSPTALTPGALDDAPAGTNGSLAQNIYEYHDGHVSLISDGHDATATSALSSVALIGTDATGSNVFFRTAGQLVPQDTDSGVDFYDARVNGGIPYTPPARPCTGDACHGAPGAPPGAPVAASVTFAGPGNDKRPAAATKVTSKKIVVTKRSGKGHTFTLTVKTPAAGRISATAGAIKPVHRSVSKAQSSTLTIRLTAKATRTLKQKRRLVIAIRVGYTPTHGSASSVRVSVTAKA